MQRAAPSLGAECLAQRPERIRKPPDSRKELPVGGHLPDADEADFRPLVERADELLERPVEDLRVRVQEQGVARVAAHQPPVVGVREAAVLAGHDAEVRELLFHELPRAVLGLIVRDEHIHGDVPRVLDDAAEARAQPVRLVRRNDDDREVVRGRPHSGLVHSVRPRAVSSRVASSTRSSAS